MTDRLRDGTSDLKPEKIPVKCPVCNSFGTLQYGKKKCHGCKGKGYILVKAKDND